MWTRGLMARHLAYAEKSGGSNPLGSIMLKLRSEALSINQRILYEAYWLVSGIAA
mgnify:CR=1 FL=1